MEDDLRPLSDDFSHNGKSFEQWPVWVGGTCLPFYISIILSVALFYYTKLKFYNILFESKKKSFYGKVQAKFLIFQIDKKLQNIKPDAAEKETWSH